VCRASNTRLPAPVHAAAGALGDVRVLLTCSGGAGPTCNPQTIGSAAW
jgi:hypothetical protein